MATVTGLLDVRWADATGFYIATVWMGEDEYDIGWPQVMRIPACGPDDFKARVRKLWPRKLITFGPVSRSKVQG